MTLRTASFGLVILSLLTAGAAVAQNQPWRSSSTGQTQQPAASPTQAQTPYGRQPYGQQPYGQPNQVYGQPNQGYGQPNQVNGPTNTPPGQGQPPGSPAQGQPMVMPPAQGQAALAAPQAPPWWPPSAVQQQYVDDVLKAWEQRGNQVELFESKFVRRSFEPDSLTGTIKLVCTDYGQLKYKKPDKGLYEVMDDGKGGPNEKWICDGRSIYVYDFVGKKLIEKPLPPQMQGKMLGEGPVPFIFGAKADKMKQQYWIRPLPAPQGVTNQIWLEAWPRTQEGKADFCRAIVILGAKDVLPIGVRRYKDNGQSRDRNGQTRQLSPTYDEYTFYETVVNPKDWLAVLKGDPFTPRMDRGWTKEIEQPRVGRRPPAAGGRQ
ncbi:MAG TPA: hypothetical protein VJL29_07380 [Thermoguttaceae bacterium]|nr:hypothetical protein [Thermoguttaceae bacterium]